jgi:spermidine/putrescine transport system ATP-binding protein
LSVHGRFFLASRTAAQDTAQLPRQPPIVVAAHASLAAAKIGAVITQTHLCEDELRTLTTTMVSGAANLVVAGDDIILDLANVFHSYGNNVVLSDLSLRVARGEFLTLLGPSGSGKSTLLRVIAGLENPTSVGRMALNGQDIAELPPNLRNVSTVFQHFALFPHMSVGQNVEYGLRLRKIPPSERRVRAEEALALVRLPDKYDRRIQQLSGGEMQRVALARSLVVRPDILLLDEPLGALDERLRLDMQIELIDIRRKTGGTFILVTHSQEEAITMSDRIVLMRSGMIEQVGTPKDLFENPQTMFASRFMGVENVLIGALIGLEGSRAAVRVGDWTIHGRPVGHLAKGVSGARVFAAVRAEHVQFVPEVGALDNVIPGKSGEAIYKGKFRDVPFQTPIGALVVRQWDVNSVTPSLSGVQFSPADCVVGLLEQEDVA